MKITHKVINFNKVNQTGGSGSIQKSFGRRIDGEIETVDWSKEDYMSKDTPVGTLFTTQGVPGFVFRILKIVDGPIEKKTETVNNNDGTISNKVIAIKTVYRICTVAINLRNGNMDGLRCFFPQSLMDFHVNGVLHRDILIFFLLKQISLHVLLVRNQDFE